MADVQDVNVQPDVVVQNHGSVFLFALLTSAAQEWVKDNVAGDAFFFGRSLVVEHRFVRNLADGMTGDGLVLRIDA